MLEIKDSESILHKANEYVKALFEEKLPMENLYHNYEHTMNVYEAGQKLAQKAELNGNDTEILLLAALFHDAGFVFDRDSHENHSKNIASEFLSRNGYNAKNIESILDCIEATQLEYVPKTKLQKLMKDADLSNLASDRYWEIAEQLRKEMNFFSEEKITKKQWIKKNLEFFESMSYYSDAAKAIFGPAKERNLNQLKAMVEDKKEKKKPKELTIATNKSAQTQFKTALRNHIDLSAIADNKANIMLSVNALIITVALPILAEKIQANPEFLYPTICLLIVSVTSMIFATLATRPIKMKGITKDEDITLKKSNLFFFGNFYRMSFDKYEEGIRNVVGEDDKLDNSITRDLFFLGKALGSKYANLRHCYNIFMFGLIITVIVFVVVLIV